MYNPYLIIVFLFCVAGILIFIVLKKVGKKTVLKNNIDSDFVDTILEAKLPLYRHLSLADKQTFRERVDYFLKTTRISPEKGAQITDEDCVLVAASATIPLLHYKHWAYENLDEVLLYPDYFDAQFDIANESRNIAGMVGAGALNHKMILSLPALRGGFAPGGDGNTAIHEFVHLIDKADGEIDGIPEYIIPKDLIDPWLHEMDKTVREIRAGKSAINSYATTNEAEFLAVTSEYFFKKPTALKEDHPQLYALLDEIYNRKG